MQVLLSPKIQAQKNKLTSYYLRTSNLSPLKLDLLEIASKFLDKEYIERLQTLLDSNRFTSSKPELSKSLDLSGQNQSEEFSILKEQQAISNFVNAVEQVPRDLREQLAKYLLEVFVDTSNMPCLLTYDKSTKTACLLQNSLTEMFSEEGITSYVLDKNLEFLTLPKQREIQSTHHKSFKERSTFQLKDPQSYHIKLGEYLEIIQELNIKLLKAFSDAKVLNHLQNFYKYLPKVVGNSKELQSLLDPIYTALKNALDIRDVEFKIDYRNSSEAFDFNLAGSSNFNEKKIKLNQKTFLDHLENLKYENIPVYDIRNILFTEVISTLIQEAVHAWQINEASKYRNHSSSDNNKATRLKDYEDNLKHYNSAFTCLALKGDLRFYYEQPLEYDSQAVSQFVTKSLLEKIQQY